MQSVASHVLLDKHSGLTMNKDENLPQAILILLCPRSVPPEHFQMKQQLRRCINDQSFLQLRSFHGRFHAGRWCFSRSVPCILATYDAIVAHRLPGFSEEHGDFGARFSENYRQDAGNNLDVTQNHRTPAENATSEAVPIPRLGFWICLGHGFSCIGILH